MWKIFIEYQDKSKCTLTGKHKEIPLRLTKEYYNLYGVARAEKAIYQQYPKKDNKPMDFLDKIEELEKRLRSFR